MNIMDAVVNTSQDMIAFHCYSVIKLLSNDTDETKPIPLNKKSIIMGNSLCIGFKTVKIKSIYFNSYSKKIFYAITDKVAFCDIYSIDKYQIPNVLTLSKTIHMALLGNPRETYNYSAKQIDDYRNIFIQHPKLSPLLELCYCKMTLDHIDELYMTCGEYTRILNPQLSFTGKIYNNILNIYHLAISKNMNVLKLLSYTELQLINNIKGVAPLIDWLRIAPLYAAVLRRKSRLTLDSLYVISSCIKK